MRARMTKAKIIEILSYYNKVIGLSDDIILYNDILLQIQPTPNGIEQWTFGSSTINGTHIIENNVIPVCENSEYAYDLVQSVEDLKLVLKQRGLTSMYIDVSEDGTYIGIDGEVYPLAIKSDKIRPNQLIAKTFDDRLSNMKKYAKNIYSSKPDEVEVILNNSHLELSGLCADINKEKERETSVRVGKNLFRTLGVVNKTSMSSAMKFDYFFIDLLSTGPTVVFLTQYKKFRAIHMYSYIEFGGK